MLVAQRGDILLYWNLLSTEVQMIDFIERLKDGEQTRFYYHCSIALDGHTQIESNGKTVSVREIPESGFDLFRAPIPEGKLEEGMNLVCSYLGQKYDWLLIMDDVLRVFTHNLVHLPVSVVRSVDRHRKICSSLVVKYLNATGFTSELTQNALPEDIWFAVKSYQVY